MSLRALGLLVAGSFLVACPSDPVDTDTDIPDPPQGPELSFTPPDGPLSAAQPFTVEVTAEDPDGVDSVTTYFRTEGARTWRTAPEMTETDGVWSLELSADAIEAPGLELYFKGDDELGSVTFLPVDGTRSPFVLPVQEQGLPLPYTQDFEDVPNDLLREIGWSSKPQAFAGYEFQVTDTEAASGSRSLRHRRAPGDITGDIDNWLITPPLDLSSLGGAAQVGWMERVIGGDAAQHSLWISTGSPDPADGEFVEITALSVPDEDGVWNRSQVVDLSDWSTATAAYVAWRYQGTEASQWWVDDVSVRALGPDLRVAGLSWDPDPLAPGDMGTLTVSLDNGTAIPAAEVVVDVVAADGATFEAPVDVGEVAGDSTVDVDIPLTIDPDYLENAWIDLEIEVSSGQDAWSFDERMLVGEPSVATVAYTLDPAGDGDPDQLMRITLGAGDPDSPTLTVPLEQQVRTSGTYEVSLDITEFAADLPPEPGDRRWWIEVVTGPVGTIDRFDITWGGEVLASTDLGSFGGFDRNLFWLPEPPDPVVVSTTPRSVSPGEAFSWTLDLRNQGASTVGETTITLSSADPDITLVNAGPVVIGEPEGWAAGADARPVFDLEVAATRKTSIPARMIATIEDDFETFEVPVDLRIPYPVLQVTGVRIDDFFGGDGDGLMEEGEAVALDIDLTNVGDLTTFGPIDCTLAITGGAATATLTESSGYYGLISANSTEDEDDFALAVDTGATGDDLLLELTCSDREETYTAPFTLTVGERPWISIAPIPDTIGDNRRSYRFDFVDGQYRSDGETLEIILRSATPHGGLTGLFIEAWGSSTGAPYTFYNIVAAGTTGTVRGFDGTFSRLGDVDVSEEDATRIRIEVDLEDLGLRLGELTVGFGAGFCGGTEQYCDHYPDAWGAPYTGLNTSRWVTLGW